MSRLPRSRYALAMGISDSARLAAQAKVSEVQSEVAHLKADLSEAQGKLARAESADSAIDKVPTPGVLDDLAKPLRAKSDASVSAAQAKVDDLAAKLALAETKLSAYQTAQGAVIAVTSDQDTQPTPES